MLTATMAGTMVGSLFAFCHLLTLSIVTVAACGLPVRTVRDSATDSSRTLEWEDFTDFWESFFRPAFFCVGACVMYLGSGALCRWLLPLSPWVSLLLLSAGAFLFPMAVLSLAIQDSITALSPWHVLCAALRCGTEYLSLLCVLAAEGFAGACVLSWAYSIPWIGLALTFSAGLYFLSVAMRQLGSFYRDNRTRIGWY